MQSLINGQIIVFLVLLFSLSEGYAQKNEHTTKESNKTLELLVSDIVSTPSREEKNNALLSFFNKSKEILYESKVNRVLLVRMFDSHGKEVDYSKEDFNRKEVEYIIVLPFSAEITFKPFLLTKVTDEMITIVTAE